MLGKQRQTNQTGLSVKRRDFLTWTAGVGGLATVGGAALDVLCPGKSVGDATVDDFTNLVGQSFRIQSEDGQSLRARLIAADLASPQPERSLRRQPFSIVLDVPRDMQLVQGNYRLSHARVGSMSLFMVPVDLPAKHNRLQAIFA